MCQPKFLVAARVKKKTVSNARTLQLCQQCGVKHQLSDLKLCRQNSLSFVPFRLFQINALTNQEYIKVPNNKFDRRQKRNYPKQCLRYFIWIWPKKKERTTTNRSCWIFQTVTVKIVTQINWVFNIKPTNIFDFLLLLWKTLQHTSAYVNKLNFVRTKTEKKRQKKN